MHNSLVGSESDHINGKNLQQRDLPKSSSNTN